MDLRLLYAMILSLLPVVELRGGLPLAILFAKDNSVPLMLIVPLIIMMNILVIFVAFYFFDHIHKALLKWSFYKNIFDKYVEKIQKKIDKFEKNYSTTGFLALAILVAIPLPGTGAWTGCILAWILDLDRKKSIIAIASGVIVAGILMLLGTLGFMTLLH